ncbi:Glutathione S transferase S1 [Carabus blaptoides fortunei]
MAPKYTLRYFNITALAEPIRFLFAYGGIEYEDARFEREEWPEIKSKMPFGQVPVLEFDGKVINQSSAICRYLAKMVKLAGKDDLQAMEIDAMVDNINDLRQKIGLYAYEADEELKEKKRVPLVNETVPFFLGKFDEIAKTNKGYFVGGELTWADLFFVAVLDYMNFMFGSNLIEKYPNLQKVKENVLAVPAIKKWVEERPKTAA